jgi:hypothetical protein
MSWVEKTEKMSEGPHSPHTPADEMNDPINSTLHSLTAPDDLDNHEDLYEDDRRHRVDDEEYRPRRRYLTPFLLFLILKSLVFRTY